MSVGVSAHLSDRRAVVIVGCLLAVVLLPGLGSYALWDPDEARHAEIAREMFTAPAWQGWILPSLNFAPYHDKPVLFYWAASLAYAIGGVGEAAARGVSVLAAIATTLLVHRWARRTWGTVTALASSTMLLTSIEFVGLARYADLNMLLTLWITAGCLAVQQWADGNEAESARSLRVAAAAAALGLLTKGFVAPVLIGGVLLGHLAATRRLARLWTVPWGQLVGIAGLIAGPWYLSAGLLDPAYLADFILRHHIDRFVRPGTLLHGKSVLFYVPIVLGGFLPWSPLLPGVVRWMAGTGRSGNGERFCAWWALTVLGFFTLSQGKLGTYILPAYPPLALLTARWAVRALGPVAAPWERPWLVCGAWVAALFLLLVPPGVYVAMTYVQGGAWQGLWPLGLPLIPFAALAMQQLATARPARALTVIAAGMVTAIVVFYRWGAPRISEVQSEAPLARMIRTADQEAGPVPVLAYSVRTPSLLFYLGRKVATGDHPKDLERALGGSARLFVVTSTRHVPDLEATGRLVPWHTAGHHQLFASMPAPD